jgi:hypothetical protein
LRLGEQHHKAKHCRLTGTLAAYRAAGILTTGVVLFRGDVGWRVILSRNELRVLLPALSDDPWFASRAPLRTDTRVLIATRAKRTTTGMEKYEWIICVEIPVQSRRDGS